MIELFTIRRWAVRALVPAVLLTVLSNLTGCTEKVYERDNRHPDHDWHDHDHDERYHR